MTDHSGSEASAVTSLTPKFGRVGIWETFQDLDAMAVEVVEKLRFGTLWLGRSPSPAKLRPVLMRTSSLTVASAIVNIWNHDARTVAAEQAALLEDFGERLVLGVGVGHSERVAHWERPLKAIDEYFDRLDDAPQPIPKHLRITAALGPKMLDVAKSRSLGTHTYLTTPEHTRMARLRFGNSAIIAAEVPVILPGPNRDALQIARSHVQHYLRRRNYLKSLLRAGFTQSDFENGGSDRLVQALVPDSLERVVSRVDEHHRAGADHVCLQVLGEGSSRLKAYGVLAEALL